MNSLFARRYRQPANQVLAYYGIDFVSTIGQHRRYTSGNILIELDFHGRAGIGGTGISSSVDTAANAITACTASRVTEGNSVTI